jgi:hypothetical protein
MSRSVSYPHDAVVVAYDYLPVECEDDWEYLWDDLLDYFIERCQKLWPSLVTVKEWIDRENMVVLENQHGRIGLSEYMGLVAYWIVPQEDEWYPQENGLHLHWCQQIADKFEEEFGTLYRVGAFSNGEVIYRKKGISEIREKAAQFT